jgi:HD-GYP domain-containing protein (c-di-GMP phosphodiesterase class II)
LALAASPSIQVVMQNQERQETLLIKTLTALTQLVHLRDNSTASHAHRVTDYALLLADRLGLPQKDKYHLRMGTPLHDLGKIGLDDATLAKAGRLTPREAARLNGQAMRAAELLEQIPSLRPLIPIVRSCRERWDGTGYPDRLSGSSIPILARIVAVADAFDAMSTDQPYRSAMPPRAALEELGTGAGTQFDPQCVAAFLELGGELEEAVRRRSQSTRTFSLSQLRSQLAVMKAGSKA